MDLDPPTRLAVAAPDLENLNRLVSRGVEALSESELLALLIRHGRDGLSALDCANQLLSACGGVFGLLRCDFSIARAQALDQAQAVSMLCAVELSKRLAAAATPTELLEDPAIVVRHLFLHHARPDQEVMGALFLDSRKRLVGHSVVFRGTHMRLVVEPRPLLREAVRMSAKGLVLFHTHPSGDPTPSQEDHNFTTRMQEGCALVGLELVDHLVIGGRRWISLRRLRPW